MRLSTCYVYVKSRNVVPGMSVSRRMSKRCAHVQRVEHLHCADLDVAEVVVSDTVVVHAIDHIGRG